MTGILNLLPPIENAIRLHTTRSDGRSIAAFPPQTTAGESTEARSHSPVNLPDLANPCAEMLPFSYVWYPCSARPGPRAFLLSCQSKTQDKRAMERHLWTDAAHSHELSPERRTTSYAILRLCCGLLKMRDSESHCVFDLRRQCFLRRAAGTGSPVVRA